MVDTQKAADDTRAVVLGITVLLLYVFFVSAVFSGFATYIYRSEWEAALENGDDTIADLDNLIFVVKREATLGNLINADRARKRVLEGDKPGFESARDIAFSEINRVKAEREKQAFHDLASFRGIDELLLTSDQTKLDNILNDTSKTVVVRADEALLLITAAASELDPADAEQVNAVVGEVRVISDRLNERHAAATTAALEAKAEISIIDAELERIENDTTENMIRRDALLEKVPLGSASRARLDALATSVPIVGNMFQRLVAFPTIFLTLIVTIAAGGLGTVVSFSRQYYAQNDVPSMARLFVNVGEGIAAAIAIFLFSGAGMLALTQGAGSQNAVELSPYMVAFVAFLSGFMAEDAFGAIQASGKRLFANKEPNGQGQDAIPGAPGPG